MKLHELEHLAQEIDKIENWSPHRKIMHGLGVLARLEISDSPLAPLKMQLISEILTELIKLESIELKKAALQSQKVAFPPDSLEFAEFRVKPTETGIFHHLHENLWLISLDNQAHFALVVTKPMSGTLNFFTHEKTGLKLHTVPFSGMGLYHLNDVKDDALYITPTSLKL